MGNPEMEKHGIASRLIELNGICKTFPGVQALGSADFDLYGGEIHALVGENGAGKSTLIKILTGVYRQDEGEIKLRGQPVAFRRPLDAQQAGIATIYQEFTLVPALTVADNIFLGHEKTRKGLINHGKEHRIAEILLSRLGADFNADALVSDLTVAQQQMVEIARALARDATVMVMDEPTAALAPREVEHLFNVLREMIADGMGIIFISHRLEEVLTIAHRITVIRDGFTISTRPAGEYTRAELIEIMVGRPIEHEYPRRKTSIGETRFEIRGLSGGAIHDISFTVARGEVLGIAGLMGAGRTEMARLIFGADRKDTGEVFLHNRRLNISTPNDAIANGICLLTEDRKSQGLVLGASAKDNFALPNLLSWSHLGWINKSREQKHFIARSKGLNIRLAYPDQRAEELSGGNQQKLLVARWLETNSEVIIFDEPTRGIDVGAKYDIYILIGHLAEQGKSIIVISSEFSELLGICDRIVVMRRGRIAGEISDAGRSTQEEIMAMAV